MEKPSIEQEVVDYTMDAIAMVILYFSSINNYSRPEYWRDEPL